MLDEQVLKVNRDLLESNGLKRLFTLNYPFLHQQKHDKILVYGKKKRLGFMKVKLSSKDTLFVEGL